MLLDSDNVTLTGQRKCHPYDEVAGREAPGIFALMAKASAQNSTKTIDEKNETLPRERGRVWFC